MTIHRRPSLTSGLPKTKPSRVLQRKCKDHESQVGGKCEKCNNKDESGILQRKANSDHEVGEVPPIVHEVLRSPGQPLDHESRTFFEPRFGHDFSRVRIHSDSQAAVSADAINALAYTSGSHVVFPGFQLQSSSREVLQLLAHELAHVVQQDSQHRFTGSLELGASNSILEMEADMAASQVLKSRPCNYPILSSSNDRTFVSRKERKNDKVGPKHIEVDLGSQTAIAFQGTTPVRRMSVSTGKAGKPTPKGNFTITERIENHVSYYGSCVSKKEVRKNVDSRKTKCKEGETFDPVKMPYFQRFQGAVGFHVGVNPGEPASAGCVRLTETDAKFLWKWAAKGTPVKVDGIYQIKKKKEKKKGNNKRTAKSAATTLLSPIEHQLAVHDLQADSRNWVDVIEIANEKIYIEDDLESEQPFAAIDDFLDEEMGTFS